MIAEIAEASLAEERREFTFPGLASWTLAPATWKVTPARSWNVPAGGVIELRAGAGPVGIAL